MNLSRMLLAFVLAAWFALSTTAAPAPPPGSQGPIADYLRLREKLPQGAPPTAASAQMKDGVLTYVQSGFIPHQVLVTETIKRDGRVEEVFRPYFVWQLQAWPHQMPAKHCTFYTVGQEGKLETLDADKAAALLKKSTPVLLGYSSELDPSHLERVKPGTLYIALSNAPEHWPGFPTPERNPPGGMAPVQSLASIDAKGKLCLTRVRNADYYGTNSGDKTVKAFETKANEKVAVDTKFKVTSLTVATVELPAKGVEAYTVDGTAISPEKLATLLAKEQTVLVALEGKKLDPFHLQLYKDNTIILVPPANTMHRLDSYLPYNVIRPPEYSLPDQQPKPDQRPKPDRIDDK